MRVLIIGGTRSIGPPVVRGLAALGHDVTVFHRGDHNAELPSQIVEINSPCAGMPVRHIPDELRKLEPDLVLHMIAMGEEDALAAARAFAGISRRIVMLSSGDVYKAYGIFICLEQGPPVACPLDEDSPLRDVRFPYRQSDTDPGQLEYYYDKILAETAIASQSQLPATILRLPKVFGPQDDCDLATVYGFRHQPQWRWTHGSVENVAAAVVAAVVNDRAAGRTYNVGESRTPTIGERLEHLPSRADVPLFHGPANFDQHIVYSTERIRRELGYEEVVSDLAAMTELAVSAGTIGRA